MRILFISNYYPPFEVGGYEQLCRDVAVRLADRGHTTAVLTSDRGVERGRKTEDPGIHRLLRIQPETLRPLANPITRRWFRTRNRTALRGGLAALAILPGTLALRRQVQRSRRVSDAQFMELCHS